MQVRSGSMPPEGAEPDDQDPPAHQPWRVDRRTTWFKLLGAVVFALVALANLDEPATLFIAGVAALLLGGHALRDLLVPVRLAADPDGLTVVSGFAGRRRLDWAQVERVRVDQRRRFGLRSQLLEIDSTETLHLFSAAELGASPDAVAAELERLRPG